MVFPLKPPFSYGFPMVFISSVPNESSPVPHRWSATATVQEGTAATGTGTRGRSGAMMQVGRGM